MRSILQVTTPVTSNVLLTTAEARSALGITDGSRDADLTRLVSRISAVIFRACKIATDGVHPPTLLSEGVTETFRMQHSMHPLYGGHGQMLLNGSHLSTHLQLSRRRVSEITSVTQDGTVLADTDYEVEPAAAILYRLGLSTDLYWRTSWSQGVIVVEYTAGFTTVPEDLKMAAETWLRTLWRDGYQTPGAFTDPLMKREEIPGVRIWERWVDPTKSPMLPEEVVSVLYDGGYIETWIA